MTPESLESSGPVRRYPCGADADDVTCDACPDPDGCIDRVSDESRKVPKYWHCPSCQAANDPGTRTCHKCGTEGGRFADTNDDGGSVESSSSLNASKEAHMYYADNLSVVAAKDIVAGDFIAFDPILGMETVMEVEKTEMVNEVIKVKVKRVGTNGVESVRYIFRGWSEPCPKVATTDA